MAREGTRSQTGHSKPRVFTNVETGPTIKRTKPAASRKTKAVPRAGKPVGVTKKAAPAKKPSVAAKAKGVVRAAKEKVAPKPKVAVAK
jgi:hypothetical protein